MKQRILVMCGVIAPLLFVFMTILGGAIRPGYSHIANTVSELLSPGSPNRFLLSTIFTIYALLIALFGIGMLLFVRRSGQSTQIGSLGAFLFIIAGMVNVTTATVFPQDPWGSTRTFAGEMHIVLSGVIGALQLFSISLFGIWFIRAGNSRGYAVYSFLTAGAVILLVGFFLMMAGTPLMGFAERVLILAGLQWTFVVALWMVSRTSSPGSRNS
jgi:hypothetical protein